ncbi:tetratricopeptide (TPR) repeat protein [Kitasatospora sp. MAA4]|uniref:regulator n=1 Tax=Kitasatospora sp. MAA4 TaxID=3035093 RepID=UPI0024769BDD|nr:regulator [Kitasatospora sp. MAA4]MDH6132073.1 tetratricopeptide (TPR) repeat protein [Kitasatospora sp. MAA4]
MSDSEAGAEGKAGEAGGRDRAVGNTVSGGSVEHLLQTSSIGTVNIHAPDRSRPSERLRVPRQIRPPFRSFVNRAAELALLTEALELLGDGAGPPIVAFTGLVGVGKTELVAQWARQERDRFPDGELYVDLGEGRHEGGVDVGVVLGRFLRSLGVEPEYVPHSTGERVTLFRSVTAGLRLLVFLDNAEHAAEVRALLPSDGLVVVAGRRRLEGLALHGARVLEVQPLTTGAGSELVRRWLGSGRGTDQELASLVRLCGGLPVALNAVAGQLLTRRRLTVHRVVADLSARHRELDPAEGGETEAVVDDAFEEVYGSLSAPGRRLYHLIGIHPGRTFTAELALAAGCEQIDEALDELLGAHLIDELALDPGGEAAVEDRYTCNDVVRRHARRRALGELSADDQADVLRRIVAYYRACAAVADRWILGERFRLQESSATAESLGFPVGVAPDLAWLERESPNFAAVLRIAAQHRWHSAVWGLCESLWPLYHGQKLYADWIDAHELGVEAAGWDARPDAEIRMRNQLARAHLELADYPRALEQLDLAEAPLRLVADPRLDGMVRETRGLICLQQDLPEEAAALFVRAREANRGDAHGVIVQSYNLAQALLACDRAQQALTVAVEAAAQAERTADRAMAMRLGVLRGRIHDRLGDTAAAIAQLALAAQQAADLKQRFKEQQARELLVELAARVGDRELERAGRDRIRELRRLAGLPPQE